MARVLNAFFLDWCPVPIAQDSPHQLRKPQNIDASNFAEIMWASNSIVKSVVYRQRFDGIYIFHVEFTTDIPTREAITNATIISDKIKTKACRHQHVFHEVHTQFRDEDSAASLYAHRAVYVEALNGAEFRSHIKSLGIEASVDRKSVEEVIEAVLDDDVMLFSVRALDSRGVVSTRPALLVLRGFHGDKRDELITSRRIIQKDRREQEASGIYNVSLVHGAVAFFGTMICFAVAASMKSDAANLIIIKGALLSCSVGVLAWVVSRAVIRALNFYMPTRKLLWDGIGYLAVCATYSEILVSIMRRAANNVKLKSQSESVSDAYKWTAASLMPLLQGDMDKMSVDFQVAAVIAAFVAAFGALLALL